VRIFITKSPAMTGSMNVDHSCFTRVQIVLVRSVHVISSEKCSSCAPRPSSRHLVHFICCREQLLNRNTCSMKVLIRRFAIVLQQVALLTRGRRFNKSNSIIVCCAGPKERQQCPDRILTKSTGYQPKSIAYVYKLSAEG
jgi:hypothetical protein